MRSGLLWALRSANAQINAQINRHAWASWMFLYIVELVFFSAYRLGNLGDLVKTSTMSAEDSTATRVWGVLLGVVQDFVVTSFLIVLLWGFDAAINHSALCNDTAPNGCLDCFTRGIPFRSRTKLIFKRILRLAYIYVLCLLSVAVFSVDVVVVRTYHRRFEFGWDSSGERLAVTDKEENTTINHVLVVALAVQGVIAIITTIWLDFTRWTPLALAMRWKSMSRRRETLPTVITSRPSVNYLVMDPDDFFDSGDNENLSAFFDSNNRPIRGTQPPQPRAILSDDSRDLPTPQWKFAVFGFGLAVTVFFVIPATVLLITSYCPPAVASIALNSNLNEPIRAITTLSFVPS